MISTGRPGADGPLAALVRDKKVIVCCGPGGAGKTTLSIALGLAAAREGRRALVLTVDPARRLAEALALPDAALRPTPVPQERLDRAGVVRGQLHAWMHNPRLVIERTIRRLVPAADKAEAILGGRAFRHLADMIAGMQEYTAAEALYDLATSGDWELIVLDTPPSRNALEFLEAPGRLARFLDERILGFFLPAGSRRFILWRKASDLVERALAKVIGAGTLRDLQQFIAAFSGMFASMRLHAQGVKSLLSSPETAFLVVATPEPAHEAEARFLHRRIREMGLPFAGFILNLSHADHVELLDPATVRLPSTAPPEARTALEKLAALGRRERARSREDRALLDRLRELAGEGVAIAAPHLGEAVEDLEGLAGLARALVASDDGR